MIQYSSAILRGSAGAGRLGLCAGSVAAASSKECLYGPSTLTRGDEVEGKGNG